MAGFWKIEKTWVQEWGLTGNEALLLADLLDWECGVKERAQRLGVDRSRLYTTLEKLTEKVLQNATPECCKMQQIVLQNATKKCCKMQHSRVAKCNTVSNIEEHIEEHKGEREDAHARAREEEAAKMGVVEPVATLAEEWKKELAEGSVTAERFFRAYGLTADQVATAIGLFVDKLALDGQTLKSRGDFRRHFNSWLKLNAKRIFDNGNKNAGTNRHQPQYSDKFIYELMSDLASINPGSGQGD